ncbi:hypothetical protein PLICRDRAFT_41529 [Plicaturopsis crispa FD-325 SS-3]|nr:hypothetical protein PLICRDRAFT_41529 [Plicaturopsis crispa FD-325 SS-3]
MSEKHAPRVVIIGCGLAGISVGIALKKQHHFENFTIYERDSKVGGTWRDNTYPGCGSDVPGHWYSLSTELNPYWKSYFISQPEIRAYWEDLYQKYDLPAHTALNTRVVSGEWDESAQEYRICVEDTQTGVQTTTYATVLVWAIGGFTEPMYPDVPGIERFKGEAWHSARWRHDVPLSGKKVAVIGNGCSAAQLIPKISDDPTVAVTNFCRTSQWYFPRIQYNYPGWVKWSFANVPGVMRAYRNFLMATSDAAYLLFRRSDSSIVKLARRKITRYIKETAPKEYLDKLIPKFAPGCKRIIVDPDYLSSLHRPNVDLSWEPIDEFVEDGLKMKSGEVFSADTIVFATGFEVGKTEMAIRGRTQTMNEYYASTGVPSAYLGTCVPGFPNLFIITGPNTATGHASLIFSDEVQIRYTMQMIKPILDGEIKSVDVKQQASDEYNNWLQDRMLTSVWNECHSYYRVGQTGKNFATFPGPLMLFWWLARKPRWDHFTTVGGVKRPRKRPRTAWLKTIPWRVLALFVGLLSTLLARRKLVQALRPLVAPTSRV